MEEITTIRLTRKVGESEQDFLERYFGAAVEAAPAELGEPEEQYLIETEEASRD